MGSAVVVFIIIVVLLIGLFDLNIENRSDFSIGVLTFIDIPLSFVIFISFALGVVFSIPLVFFLGRKKKNIVTVDANTSKSQDLIQAIAVIVFIIIVILFIGFIVLNLENRSDFSIGVLTFIDIPLFFVIFTFFTLGVVFYISLAFFIDRKKKSMVNPILLPDTETVNTEAVENMKTNKFCHKCGERLGSQSRFCPSCGESQKESTTSKVIHKHKKIILGSLL